MEQSQPDTKSLPQGYRQGLVTAITVFVGFSLAFMRFWSLETGGAWTWKGFFAAAIIGGGVVVQLYALWRSLELTDDEPARYTSTVRWFFVGVATVIVGVMAAIIVAA